MITFQELIDDIVLYIKKNGKKYITGDILQKRLLNMVDKTKETYDENRKSLVAQREDIEKNKKDILHIPMKPGEGLNSAKQVSTQPNKALGQSSFAGGYGSVAGSIGSVAFGNLVETSNPYEVAFGDYNRSIQSNDPDKATLFSIGNGRVGRHNAFELKKSGKVFFGEVELIPSLPAENKKALAEQGEKIKALEKTSGTQSGEISAIKVRLAEGEKKIESNGTAITQAQGDIETLQGQRVEDKALLDSHSEGIKSHGLLIEKNKEDIRRINESKGKPNGLAQLDSEGKLVSSQIPDAVDDIKEGILNTSTKFTDSTGKVWIEGVPGIESKIFLDTDTNKTYRWSGSQFTVVGSDLALGETSSTAYAGDKGKRNADDIKKLFETTQLKDLVVDITNTGGHIYMASKTASEIAAYARLGGNVKIEWQERVYFFNDFTGGVAQFRNIDVQSQKAVKREIAVQWNGEALLSEVVYESVFDASKLVTSLGGKVTQEFKESLVKAIAENRMLYVTSNGVTYKLVANESNGQTYRFTGVGGRTVYVVTLKPDLSVSLDTHNVGYDISVFNNREGANILNLTIESTADEIKEVFTDNYGEVVLPNTGDIFNIFQNSDMANSGIVSSMVEDSAEIRLAVDMSNFEDNLIHRRFFKIYYDVSRGFDSLKITNVVDNVINPSKLTEDAVAKMETAIARTADLITEYNISKINQAAYDLQGAVSALNEYLGGGARYFGMKVTFIDSSEMIPKTFKFVKGTFTSTLSWQEVVPYRVINQLVCGMDSFGHARGLSVDIEDMYKICGFDLIIYGHGTPSALTIPEQKGVPAFIGQVYIDLDASSNGRYYAKGTDSVSDWVK